jgi:flagellar hook-associated protein FlgK
MPGISSALNASANHLRALETALSVIQSNVGNASSPGYARQDLVGGDGPSSDVLIISSRDEYAEQTVRQQNSLLGKFDQLSSVLRVVESRGLDRRPTRRFPRRSAICSPHFPR